MSKWVVLLVIAALCTVGYAESRIWKLTSGERLEGEFIKVAFDAVYLRLADGKETSIPLEQLSEEERTFIQLMDPPELKVKFFHKEDNLLGYYKGTLFLRNRIPPTANQHHFGASVEVTGNKPYDHPLKVEYYAIGVQLQDRDKYILMEKRSKEFTPSEDNGRSLEFKGNEIKVISFNRNGKMGRDYSGYIVVVTDRRGEIIAHEESKYWLFEHLDKLRQLPVGSFFDNTCKRVYPTGATSTRH